MNGFDLASRFTQGNTTKNTPIIMVVSEGKREDAKKCKDAGVSGYMSKPVKPAELAEMISTILGLEDRSSSLITIHSIRERKKRAPHRIDHRDI